MKWLKLMLVLGVVFYGAYLLLIKWPGHQSPRGITKDWANPPDIQLGIVDDDRPAPPTSSIGAAKPLDATKK